MRNILRDVISPDCQHHRMPDIAIYIDGQVGGTATHVTDCHTHLPLLLGEHHWWGKNVQPWFDETIHLPLFIWDPRAPAGGERRQSLVQTIDLAPTILEYFAVDRPADSQGAPLHATIADDTPVRDAGLFGIFAAGVPEYGRVGLIRSRERSKSTPIIFLTAAADEMTSMFRGYEVGAVDYLMKPVIPEVLKSKVAVFVELFGKSERLRDSEDKLRRLAAHLISVREEERAHIAREIHDELGQVLTGLKMEVTWLAKRLREKPLIEKTDSMCKLIDTTVQTVRKIATGLRPEMLDDMGLIAAVAWQAKEFQKRTGIRCRAKLPPETQKPDTDISTTMFRIFQEILTNVARHSRATRVDIELTIAEDQIALDVTGRGRRRTPVPLCAGKLPAGAIEQHHLPETAGTCAASVPRPRASAAGGLPVATGTHGSVGVRPSRRATALRL